MKVLITGAHGDIAQSIFRIIKTSYSKTSIHGMDCKSDGPGKYLFEKFILSRKASDKNYIKFVKKLSKKYNLLIPTSEAEMICLSKNYSQIKNLPILINKPKIISLFVDKLRTYNFLKGKNIDVPSFCVSLVNLKKYTKPFFLKTKLGSGNKNYKIINSKEKFNNLKKIKKNKWIAQEFLGYDTLEFTCGLIKVGKFKNCIILKRKLTNGLTYYAEVYKSKKLEKILYKIADLVDLNGCINIQLKLKNKKFKIFEINPRLSSTVMMRHKIGFMDCIWWINYYLMKKTPSFKKKKTQKNKILRVYNELFV